jgi:hypothetical protein
MTYDESQKLMTAPAFPRAREGGVREVRGCHHERGEHGTGAQYADESGRSRRWVERLSRSFAQPFFDAAMTTTLSSTAC